jgi:hypothetical protein
MKKIRIAILAAILIGVGSIWGGSANHARSDARGNWEYRIVTIQWSGQDSPEVQINRLGGEGWELVQAKFRETGGAEGVYVFKRPK